MTRYRHQLNRMSTHSRRCGRNPANLTGRHLDRRDPDPIQIDPDSDPDRLGEFTRKLLQTIRRNPLISRKLLAVELNASERKVRDSLKNLKDSGFVVRQGPDHGGIWRVSRIVRSKTGAIGSATVSEKTTLKRKTTPKESTRKDGYGKTSQAIVEVLKRNPQMTIPELAHVCELSTDGVKYQLRVLTTAGVLRRVGGRKHGHWEVLAVLPKEGGKE